MTAAQVHAELIKLRSLRSLWLPPAAALLLPPLTAVIVGLTGSMEAGDTVLGGSLTGAPMALTVIAAWGALVVTTEFGSGTIRPVLAATPQRGALLRAKAVVVAGVAALVSSVSITTAWLIGGVAIDSAKYAAGEPFPGLIGIYCCFPAVALLGLAVGVVLRSSVGAVAAVTAHLVLPQLTAAQVLGDLHKWVTVIAPSTVVAKLAQSADAAPELVGTLGGWPRLALVLAGVLGALVAAQRVLDRADM
ncbi:ABC transporter permease [Nocardia sp. NPDC050435]|uniref:ABC transporter permease n=1 Tax=Nocardia sp. NPDC050435 TaxID=3155040 RepID=UPI0033F1FD53